MPFSFPFHRLLFTAGIILLAEKLFLRFVAINFHQRALADPSRQKNRLGEALEPVYQTLNPLLSRKVHMQREDTKI